MLADGPIEFGDFDEQDFSVSGVPYRVVLYGVNKTIDRAKLKDYCQRVAAAETGFFNNTPFKRYVFMFHDGGGTRGGAGGLEHLGSTEISLFGKVDDRVRFVIAHEFFHAWNVKRIPTLCAGSFDYINPPHTANLWWSEGITDYYARLLSRRGGLYTDEEALKDLATTISDLQNNPARLRVSADEFEPVRVGGQQQPGQRALLLHQGRPGGPVPGHAHPAPYWEQAQPGRRDEGALRTVRPWAGAGFGEDDILKTANRFAGQDIGSFTRCARSYQEMPFAESLGYAGLKLNPGEITQVPNLGMTMRPNADFSSFSINMVDAGGAAEKAGLMAGRSPPGDQWRAHRPPSTVTLRTAKVGASFTITIERAGEKRDVAYTVGSRRARYLDLGRSGLHAGADAPAHELADGEGVVASAEC